MCVMNRLLPVSREMANLALLDVIDNREQRGATRDTDGRYRFQMEVYGNLCGFAAQTLSGEGGTILTVELTEPSAGLSPDGQERTVRYLLDSVEQLMENELGAAIRK